MSEPSGNRTFGDSIEIRTEGLGPAGKDGVRSAPRDATRRVHVGKVPIGGGAPVVVQSMTTTMTWDVPATLEQIRRLEEAGCEIVRVAVPDEKSADALPEIVKGSPLPVVADIHFTWKLGLKAIAAGVHKVRINPGNIGGESRVQEIVAAAKDKGIPIRVGANAGSLPKEIIAKYGVHDPLGIVEAALIPIGILEKAGFEDIVVSMKASDVGLAVASYRLASRRIPYPLHIGITEAGSTRRGSIKSAVGLGMLLEEGIGDTMRVSLTADPVEEIETAFMILSAVGLRQRGPEVISCPSCGRCDIDLIGLATTVENRVKALGTKIPLKVAVMGCEVNGPGEARDADVGIAGGLHEGLIFKNGEILRKVKENRVVDELMIEVEKVLRDKEADAARREGGA
ncbi:MAG: flavodoxin-dependent (E)-4-hydroxy-3-methylbut-2-enyl-diphosphate synthase [Candidatus Eisenbacteria bacterium]